VWRVLSEKEILTQPLVKNRHPWQYARIYLVYWYVLALSVWFLKRYLELSGSKVMYNTHSSPPHSREGGGALFLKVTHFSCYKCHQGGKHLEGGTQFWKTSTFLPKSPFSKILPTYFNKCLTRWCLFFQDDVHFA